MALTGRSLRVDMDTFAHRVHGNVDDLRTQIQPMLSFVDAFTQNGGFDTQLNGRLTLPGFLTLNFTGKHSTALGLPQPPLPSSFHINQLQQQSTNANQSIAIASIDAVQPNRFETALHLNSGGVDLVPVPPTYHLQAWIKTVVDCWKEYDEGISPGYPEPKWSSIRELDKRYGAAWRKLDMTCKAYS